MRTSVRAVVGARVFVCLAALFAASCGDARSTRHAASVSAFERGDVRAAIDQLSELRAAALALEEIGPDDARVLHDAALMALVAQEWRAAEESAGRIMNGAAGRWTAHAALMVGVSRHERARLSALQALGPEVEPFAFEAALAQVRSAQAAYVQVLVLDGEVESVGAEVLLAAARNLERCERLATEIERLRAEAEAARARREADGDPNVQIVPEDGGAAEAGEVDDESTSDAPWTDLSPEELAALEALLGDKEREKLDLRRARRERRSSAVERDW